MNTKKYQFVKTVNIILLSIVFLLALYVRLTQLENVPPGVLVDEAAQGYNAYSILKTGKDEWGNIMPLTFKSFGDFKPPGFIYTLVFFVKVFGLSMFSIRLPSALAGIVTLVCTFFIVRSIAQNKLVAVIATVILAIAPWHIYIHRLGIESSLAMTWFYIGVVFIVRKPLGKRDIFLSAIFLGLSAYTYLGYRILVPVFACAFGCVLYKQTKNRQLLAIFTCSLIVILAPLVFETSQKGSGIRIRQLVDAKVQGVQSTLQEAREFCGFSKISLLNLACLLTWNKPVYLIKNTAELYLQHLYPSFLFAPGEESNYLNNTQHGGLYFWLVPFFFVGLAYGYRRIPTENRFYMWTLLFLAPFGSLVGGVPSYTRANNLLIPVTLFCALGIVTVSNALRKHFRINPQLLNSLLLLLALYSFLSVFLDYFYVYTKKSNVWEEEYPQLYSSLARLENSYDQIVVKKMHDNPYIYYLFFRSIDPAFYQSHVERFENGIVKIGKYSFISTNINKEYCRWLKEDQPKTLYIGNDAKLLSQPLINIKTYNGVYSLVTASDFSQIETEGKSNQIMLPDCTKPQ